MFLKISLWELSHRKHVSRILIFYVKIGVLKLLKRTKLHHLKINSRGAYPRTPSEAPPSKAHGASRHATFQI